MQIERHSDSQKRIPLLIFFCSTNLFGPHDGLTDAAAVNFVLKNKKKPVETCFGIFKDFHWIISEGENKTRAAKFRGMSKFKVLN